MQNADNAVEEEAVATLPATEKGLRYYWKSRNQHSLDGLPGLKYAPEAQARLNHVDRKKFQYKEYTASSGTRWITSQTVAAFTLGVVTSVSVLKVLQQQRYV